MLANSLNPQLFVKIMRAYKPFETAQALLHAGGPGLLSKWW